MARIGAIERLECRDCGHTADRYVTITKLPRPCENCGGRMRQPEPGIRNRVYVGIQGTGDMGSVRTKSGEIVRFTGPRQKARVLAENNLVEVGNEKVENVHSYFDRKEVEAKEARAAERRKVIDEVLQEAGDSLWTSDESQATGEHDFDIDSRAVEHIREHTGNPVTEAIGNNG